MADDKRPIIIKKVKKVEGGHHGGAWKVAYADFVTAMMAFFLLLWLLSTADDATLVGIAEYFEPTIGVKDSLGIGFEGGESPDSEVNIRRSEASPVGIVVGQPKQGPIPGEPDAEAPVTGEEENQLYESAEEFIRNAFESDPALRDLSDNVIVEQSPEGLKISVADSDKYAMFERKKSTLTVAGKTVLGNLLPVIEAMPNYASISGHTDVAPHSKTLSTYTNWELSTDRANAARRYLLKAGMNVERTQKIVGLASSDLLVPERPTDARNRRVTIIMLRSAYMTLPDWSLPAARDLLAVPGSENEASSRAQKAQRAIDANAGADADKDSDLPEFYQ